MASQIKSSAILRKINGVPDFTLVKRKFDSSCGQSLDSNNRSVSVVTKSEVKSEPSDLKRTKTTTTVIKTREKKVYSLPGQKHDPPEEREPLRIFYESLLKQIPSSEMAEFWMMEHGLLSLERAKKAHEKKQTRQKENRIVTPTKKPLLKTPTKKPLLDTPTKKPLLDTPTMKPLLDTPTKKPLLNSGIKRDGLPMSVGRNGDFSGNKRILKD